MRYDFATYFVFSKKYNPLENLFLLFPPFNLPKQSMSNYIVNILCIIIENLHCLWNFSIIITLFFATQFLNDSLTTSFTSFLVIIVTSWSVSTYFINIALFFRAKDAFDTSSFAFDHWITFVILRQVIFNVRTFFVRSMQEYASNKFHHFILIPIDGLITTS